MKLHSILVVFICGISSVFAAGLLWGKKSDDAPLERRVVPQMKSDDDDDFVLVDIDKYGSGEKEESVSVFYPNLDKLENRILELDRIESRFVNGKMTDGTTIDLLVLVYHMIEFGIKSNYHWLVPKMINEIFHIIIEIPDIAYNAIRNAFYSNSMKLSSLHLKLINAASSFDPMIYENIQFIHDISNTCPPFEKNTEVKTINAVKDLFDLLRTNIKEADCPYVFLNDVNLNWNVRNYLRFFVGLYAVSLQSRYFVVKTKFSMPYLHLLFFDAASVFLDAFPNEISTSLLAVNLSKILKYSREKIVGIVRLGKGRLKSAIQECVAFGLQKSLYLLSSLKGSYSVPMDQNHILMRYAFDQRRLGAFATLYQQCRSLLTIESRCNALKVVMANSGCLDLVTNELVEPFSMKDWEILVNEAYSKARMNVMKALLRASFLDNSVFNGSDLTNNSSPFYSYVSEAKHGRFSESSVIDLFLTLPKFEINRYVLLDVEKHLPNLCTIAKSNLKSYLVFLIDEAREGKYESVKMVILEIEMKISIPPYYFRKLMCHLNPVEREALEIIECLLSRYHNKAGYVEEAAYGAMEVLNMDLLELLVNNYSFEITETFAKRWIVRCFMNWVEAQEEAEGEAEASKIVDFKIRFAERMADFSNSLNFEEIVAINSIKNN